MGHCSHLSTVLCNRAKSDHGTEKWLHHRIQSLGTRSLTSKHEMSLDLCIVRELGQLLAFRPLSEGLIGKVGLVYCL